MSIETMTKLATITITDNTTTVATFSNIPQEYTDLLIRGCTRDTNVNGAIVPYINSSLGTSTTSKRIGYNGSSAYSDTATAYWAQNGSNETASVFTNWEMYIPNYSTNLMKLFSVEVAVEHNGNTINNETSGLSGTIWNNTAPFTSIGFYTNQYWAQYSTFILYGVKASRKVVGNSVKATGGAITFDGTYVYHSFNTTDTFIPTANILADVVVVAGGGGGGGHGVVNEKGGGGGGAGGLLGFTNQTFTAGTSYLATVGAGGAGGAATPAQGTNGGNSSLGSLTTCVGGGGGGAGYPGSAGAPHAGKDGGSGGGATGGGTPGIGTAGQGTNGGSAPDSTPYAGAGGGGAGFLGGNQLASAAGIGGQGVSTYSSWGFGHLVSGVRWLAGGGGGGAGFNNTANFGVGGLGGGGNGGSSATSRTGYNAVASTGGGGGGGGGGGASNASTGGNGGSGLIVVRYKA